MTTRISQKEPWHAKAAREFGKSFSTEFPGTWATRRNIDVCFGPKKVAEIQLRLGGTVLVSRISHTGRLTPIFWKIPAKHLPRMKQVAEEVRQLIRKHTG